METVLDPTVISAISDGFTTVSGMIKEIIVIGVPATIGVIALASGARYGIRWVRGLISKA